MGVDSGLPDFRGNEGFWNAYPPLRQLNISFVEMAQPDWFIQDPELAWGFYGHRLHLYRATIPHEGFHILRQLAERKAHGGFVLTSNVDGQFQKAGFSGERIMECHGSIHHLQCSVPCCSSIWSAEDLEIEVDPTTFRAQRPLPACIHCGAIARPNILMFGDGDWLPDRTDEQDSRMSEWLSGITGRSLVVVECGAGTAIPTVRRVTEGLIHRFGARAIRINLRDPQGPKGMVSLPMGALEALKGIAREIGA